MTFDLGGYGIYVWPAYGIAALVMLGLLAAALRAVYAHERGLARLQAARPPRLADPLIADDGLPFDGRGDGG
jgi:heme exporter protein CcmD